MQHSPEHTTVQHHSWHKPQPQYSLSVQGLQSNMTDMLWRMCQLLSTLPWHESWFQGSPEGVLSRIYMHTPEHPQYSPSSGQKDLWPHWEWHGHLCCRYSSLALPSSGWNMKIEFLHDVLQALQETYYLCTSLGLWGSQEMTCGKYGLGFLVSLGWERENGGIKWCCGYVVCHSPPGVLKELWLEGDQRWARLSPPQPGNQHSIGHHLHGHHRMLSQGPWCRVDQLQTSLLQWYFVEVRWSGQASLQVAYSLKQQT